MLQLNPDRAKTKNKVMLAKMTLTNLSNVLANLTYRLRMYLYIYPILATETKKTVVSTYSYTRKRLSDIYEIVICA